MLEDRCLERTNCKRYLLGLENFTRGAKQAVIM